VLLALAGSLLLLGARRSKNLKTYFSAGLCMGLSFLMKQPGMVFILFGAQEILCNGWKERTDRKRLGARLCAYLAAAALPYLLTCAALYRAGVFRRFWFWTVSYASQYGTSTELLQGWEYLKEVAPQLFFAAPVVWCFAASGILAVIIDRGKGAPLSFAFSLLGWSFVGASAGLYYRKHYFILMLPAVCLMAGTAMKCLADRIARRVQLGTPSVVPAALFAVGYLASLYTQRAEFFLLSPAGVIRHQYGGNPFPEAIEFCRYIREHSEAGTQVAVLGSEPEIYFYAARHSATGYIYTYGLMEEQRYASRMQQEMMD